jgi:TolB-like protein/tetratricopeptide (TPR) repeat protein
MPRTGARYTLNLLGAFRLLKPEGERVEISSKKGVALVALLAMANEGEHTRGWLQDKLWGSREQAQARASVRRELSNLRKLLNRDASPLLICEHDRVRLDLRQVHIDARAPQSAGSDSNGAGPARGEFLEGLDLAGEDEFEEWLREQRAALREGRPARQQGAHREIAPSSRVEAAAATNGPAPGRFVDVSQPAPGFSGRPALAVLPFVNMTGEAENDYLSEGISEDLINRLSKLRWLPVIARSSSFSFGVSEEEKAISEGLGAKYLLGGVLRRASDGFTVTANLTDAETGYVVLSQKLGLPNHHTLDAVGQLMANLVAILDARIDHAEQAQAHAKPQSDLNVNELIWRGRWHLNRFTREDGRLARELFAEALAQEPGSPEALIQATFCLAWSIWAQRTSGPQVREMRKLAQQAMVADPDDSRGYMLAGVAELWLRHPRRAKLLIQQAISLNPSLALAHAELGSTYIFDDEPDLAVEPLTTALRLSPNDQQVFYILGELAMTYSMLGEWGRAIDYADQSIIHRAAYWYGYVVKINALARSGAVGEAAAVLDELLAAKPDFTADYMDWIPFREEKWPNHFKEGVAIAARYRRGHTETEPSG